MSENPEKRKTEFVPRILHLDAESFDSEIKTLLHNQLLEVSKYLTPGALDKFKSEINLVLNLLIFKYSLVNKNATFGQDIFKLKYKNKLSTVKLTAFALLNYVLPYLTSKLEDKSTKLENKTLEKMVKRIQVLFQACTVLNLLVFLREGKYPTLVDRLLKLQYSPAKPIDTHVGYNFMIKELLLQGIMIISTSPTRNYNENKIFAERSERIKLLNFSGTETVLDKVGKFLISQKSFLTNVLPFINTLKIKRKLARVFEKKSNNLPNENKLVFNIHTRCVVCNEFPTIPSQISVYCPHVACYYCIKSNILADAQFTCPACCQPHSGFGDLEFTLLDWVRRRLSIQIK